MPSYHLDYETRSRVDIRSQGSHRYANDPSTKILCCAVAKDDEDPVIWRVDTGGDEALALMREVVDNPDNLIYAHNATGFEVPVSDALWEKTFGFPPPQHHQWRCTAVMARKASLPYHLGKLGEALGITNQKDKSGTSLIGLFSIPQKDGSFTKIADQPQKFDAFCEYCLQDVRAEREVHRLLHRFELKGAPLDTFLADMEMNLRGIPINLDAVANARSIVEDAAGPAEAQFEKLTGLSTSQTVKLQKWANERGYPHDNFQSDTLSDWLETAEDGDLKTALSIRALISFAANKKLKPMAECAGPHDNKVRGTMMYLGALRTGRWSSSLVQVQNIKKPSAHLSDHTQDIYRLISSGVGYQDLDIHYGNPLEAVASCMRHFIDDGKPMWDVDYSAIEARIVAWLAGEGWVLDVFRGHGKIYEATASQMFKVPFEDFAAHKKEKGSHHPMRAKGKVATLSCSYGGSTGALIKMGALRSGLTEAELPPLVEAWREANPKIVALWDACNTASRRALNNPGEKFKAGEYLTYFSGRTAGMNFLFCRLPSGRCLCYPRPRMEDVKAPWDETQTVRQLTYYGKLPNVSSWGRVSTYGPKLVENCLAGDTLVLTLDRGWVRLDTVRDVDLLWDGIDYVNHRGLVKKGVQETIYSCGLNATPDHLILCEDGWVSADKACHSKPTVVCLPNEQDNLRPPSPKTGGVSSRAEGGASSRFGARLLRWAKELHAMSVRLRGGGSEEDFLSDTDKSGSERLLTQMPARERSCEQSHQNTRAKQTPTLRCVAIHARSVPTPNTSGLVELRSAGDNCVRTVGNLRKLLERYVSRLATWVGFGPHRQRQRVCAQQLPMGDTQTKLSEHTVVSGARVGIGSGGCQQRETIDLVLPTKPRGADGGRVFGASLCEQPVYDVVNCGPRSRFVARGSAEAPPVIVHNCTQAVAADIMANGLVNAERHGYRAAALIHDEFLGYKDEGQSAEELIELLTDAPEWATDLPLAADGGEIPFYLKD